jgi:hypothetical protein
MLLTYAIIRKVTSNTKGMEYQIYNMKQSNCSQFFQQMITEYTETVSQKLGDGKRVETDKSKFIKHKYN